MPKVTFIEHNGAAHEVEAKPGQSLMEAAVKNGVPGIDADCGGSCACGTCRVYVDESWRAPTGEPAEKERSMIEFINDASPNLRLSCQIPVTDALDGLVVRMPKSQH